MLHRPKRHRGAVADLKLMNAVDFTGGEEEQIDGMAPTFKEKPKIIPNETGTLITMKCKCQAKPAPVVTWFKDQTQVKESSRIKMKCTPLDNDFYELVLELKVIESLAAFERAII